MVNTSTDYKNSVVKNTRSSKAVISFGIYDVTAKDDAEPIANTSQTFIDIDNIVNNVQVPEYNIGTFEDDYFDLGTGFNLMPDDIDPTYDLGWWSQFMSLSDGTFAIEPMITINFDDLHSSLGIGIFFDSIGGSYCSEFEVKWYNGVTLLNTILIDDNTDTFLSIEESVENYDLITIRLIKTDKPYRYAKISEINFGVDEIFTSDNIISAEVTEEVDPLSNSISLNKLKFTVLNEDQRFNMINPDSIYQFLQARQQLVAQSGLQLDSGLYEFVPMGVFYLSDWENSTGITASLEATDVLGLLDRTTYYSSLFWVNEPIENVIQHILNDAGNFSFNISAEVSTEVVNGYIPIMSHREALQYVLIATKASIKSDRYGIMNIFRPDYTTVDKEIDFNTTTADPTIKQKQLITEVKATDYTYNLGASESIYSNDITFTGQRVLILPHDKAAAGANLVITGNGSVVGSPTYSVTSTTVEVLATGTFSANITGQPYEETISVETASIALSAGEIPQSAELADNKLLVGIAQDIAQSFLDYYQKRIKQIVQYTCDPSVESGDNASVETIFNTTESGIIEKQDITFAPALSARLEVTG